MLFNLISCAFLSSREIIENDEKKHHLTDGTFKNRFDSYIDKSFLDLIKWWWNGETPIAVDFEIVENDPQFLKNNKESQTLT